MAKVSRLLITGAALAAVAGLTLPSDGSAMALQTTVTLTAAGPSPSTVKMTAGQDYLIFSNQDSATHTVVFANGCSLTLAPGEQVGPGAQVGGGPTNEHPNCNDNFSSYVGSYSYMVDGRFAGTVHTVPSRRSVTLTAAKHTIRRGAQLTLHGAVTFNRDSAAGPPLKVPFPVIVLARHSARQPFERIAMLTVPRSQSGYFWHLRVRPRISTTYIAEVKGQPRSGKVWSPARSGRFAVRIRR